jgi:hypothetical protein
MRIKTHHVSNSKTLCGFCSSGQSVKPFIVEEPKMKPSGVGYMKPEWPLQTYAKTYYACPNCYDDWKMYLKRRAESLIAKAQELNKEKAK